jgi:hypothetical protein
MNDTPNPFGRSSVHIVPEGATVAHQPAFNNSVGMGRRPVHYVNAAPVEQKGPGIAAQEITQGGDHNVIRQLDAEGKAIGLRVTPTAQGFAFLTPCGNFPLGREPTIRDCVNVPGLGVLRVREALALGVLTSDNLQAQASPLQQYDALVKHVAQQEQKADPKAPEAPKVDPKAAEADAALHASYVQTAQQLDAEITKAGGNTDTLLTELAKSAPSAAVADLAGRVAQSMGPEAFQDAISAMELRVLDAVSRAVGDDALDAVCEVLESEANSARYARCWTHYLRTGDATLLSTFAREVARGLR